MLFLMRSRRFRGWSLRGEVRPRPVSSWPRGLHGGGPRVLADVFGLHLCDAGTVESSSQSRR